MTGFGFEIDGGLGPTPAGEKSFSIDHLISAAGGAPLPGKLGVVQAVVGIWTTERHGHPALGAVQNLLLTAGVLRAYKRSEEGSIAVEDPVDAYYRTHGLTEIDALEQLDHLVWSTFMSRKVPYVDIEVGDQGCYRKFDNGAYFRWYTKARMKDAEQAGYRFGATLLAHPSNHDRLQKAVVDLLWLESQHGIELVVTGNRYGSSSFAMLPLTAPGAYIDSPLQHGHTQILAEMANRCRKFRSHNLSRGILFHGVPGVGKSSLARALAVLIGDGRVLRLDPKVLADLSNDVIAAMVELLQPTVLLLDDMDRSGHAADGLLARLESKRVPVVVGTVNVVTELDPALLRPGRFDEVVEIPKPDREWSGAILDFYCAQLGVTLEAEQKDMVEGLAPAEILELVRVASIVGVESWAIEVDRVRMQSLLYDREAVAEFLARRRSGVPTGNKAAPPSLRSAP